MRYSFKPNRELSDIGIYHMPGRLRLVLQVSAVGGVCAARCAATDPVQDGIVVITQGVATTMWTLTGSLA